jgi:sulfur carrier protein
MQVVINGRQRVVEQGLRLDQAVALLTGTTAGVAVAVNGDVIRRAEWQKTELADGDQVEVLTAVQGG